MDGCRAGWFAVAIRAERSWQFGVYPTIRALSAAYPEAALSLIDIPIGLPLATSRTCDAEARRLLGQRMASSIFPVPCRAAFSASDYREACAINLQVLGAKLSKQTWNILPKIREVDEWLQREGNGGWRECHPELALWALGGRQSRSHGKKTMEGRDERLALLRTYFSETDAVLEAALNAHPRKALASHDILDALALAVTAWLSGGELARVPARPAVDAMGLPMEIVFLPGW